MIFQAPRVSKNEFAVSTGEEVLVFLLFFLQEEEEKAELEGVEDE